jgi:hypothetical protein
MDDVSTSVECAESVSARTENTASSDRVFVQSCEGQTASNRDTTSSPVDLLDELVYRHVPLQVIGKRQVLYTAAQPLLPRSFVFEEDGE